MWHKPIEAVAAQIALNAPTTAVACAYLELSSPDLPTVTDRLVSSGVQIITIVPLFLGVGKHARDDLPVLVAELRRRYALIEFTLRPPVGEDARLIQLLADIALHEPLKSSNTA